MTERRRWSRWHVAALSLALAARVSATDDPLPLSQLVHGTWGTRDGLPSHSVRPVLAARSGYVWAGTEQGLVRFDGARFTIYDRLSSPGLGSDGILALAEGRDELWIGTSAGLSRLKDGRIESLADEVGSRVEVLLAAGDALWVGTHDGLAHRRQGEWEWHRRADGLPDDLVTALALVGPDELWIGTPRGLAVLSGGAIRRLDEAGLPSPFVNDLLVLPDRTVLAGTDHGLARRRPGAAVFEADAAVGDRHVRALRRSRDGMLWAATTRGLLRLGPSGLEVLGGTPGQLLYVRGLAEDTEGGLWFGTEASGLHRLRRGGVVAFGPEEGLGTGVALAVLEDPAGAILVSGPSGLHRIRDGRVEELHATLLGGAIPTALLEDADGTLWIGTERAGVLRVGRDGHQWLGLAGGATSTARVLHRDRSGTLWLGTSLGVARLLDGHFEPVVRSEGLVVALADAPGGGLWVGTTAGLARLEGGRLVRVPFGARAGGEPVASLLADPDGTLWIATNGDGLWRRRGEASVQFGRRQGLHEESAFAVLDDGRGALWLTGYRGLSRVQRSDLEEVGAGRRQELAPTVLGVADGMKDSECMGSVQPAALRARDGRLWFPTVRGVATVDPAHLAPNLRPPPVLVEEVLADGQAIGLPRGEASLELPAGTRRVDIRYTSLALAAADRIRFRHRLEGLDNRFVDAGQERVARYAGLGPGEYRFTLGAVGENGARNDAGATLTFEILPRVWETRWFRALGALLAAMVALGYHRLRVHGLVKRQRELSAEVEAQVAKMKVLTGLLPICAWCKRIKDDAGEWHQLETYVTDRTHAEFSHGMCPQCFERMDDPPRGQGGGTPG